MSLSPGTRLGAYEVLSSLGAGGMGEVYRARDTRLHRDVAVKILPEAFADSLERLARFEREAQALASLNHPNIAAIYGVEDATGTASVGTTRALILELVEGPTLADRIASGALSLDEALPIARQIADALIAAHDQGIIHRDLKPSNIKVRDDGTVKVLDFGLAKMLDPGPGLAGGSLAATVTSPAATRAGVILGTAAYMAPEQATGKAADRRADIWAFGVILYEMLTGTRPFGGETVNEVISEILKSEPDWTRVSADTPASIQRLVRRCLQKDRARRLRDIADARLEIDEAPDPSPLDRSRSGAASTRANWRWVAALAVVGGIAVVQTVRLWQPAPVIPSRPETRLELTTPVSPFTGLAGGEAVPESLAISPDGSKLVFAAATEGRLQLWLRGLDSVTPRPLAGTDRAVYPFWSPDSRSIGFFADSQLKRIDIEGGTIRALARASFGLGGAWTSDGAILFTPIFSGPLYRVPAEGGEVKQVTSLASGQGHHRLPRLLPDNRHFLFVASGAQAGVYVGDLNGTPPRRILDAQYAEVHAPTRRLLFVRQGTVFSQPFDMTSLTLTGNPAPLVEQAVALSASSSGPIVYRPPPPAGRHQFVWFDRSGRELGRLGEPDPTPSGEPALSPDGRSVAISRTVDGNPDVWLLDTIRGVLSRFTFESSANYSLRWSPDGKRVVYNSNRNGIYDLYIKSASGAGSEELLLSGPLSKSASDWSPDGRLLLFRSVDPETSHDLWAMPVDGDRKPFPVVRTNFVEAYGQFSPDGKWLAYQSNESGRFEVYVQPFPGPGPKLQISKSGGAQMRWKRDGRELFYLDLEGHLIAVGIRPGASVDSLDIGEPTVLFTAHVGEIVPLQSGYSLSYAVAADGRFLIYTLLGETTQASLNVILNWKPPQ